MLCSHFRSLTLVHSLQSVQNIYANIKVKHFIIKSPAIKRAMVEICSKDVIVAVPAAATRGVSLESYLAHGARLVEEECKREDEGCDSDNIYSSSASDTLVDERNVEPPNVLRNRKKNTK